jgi:hypothetical protein
MPEKEVRLRSSSKDGPVSFVLYRIPSAPPRNERPWSTETQVITYMLFLPETLSPKVMFRDPLQTKGNDSIYVTLSPRVTFRDPFLTAGFGSEPLYIETAPPTCTLAKGVEMCSISVRIASLNAIFTYGVFCIRVTFTSHDTDRMRDAFELDRIAPKVTLRPRRRDQVGVWV